MTPSQRRIGVLGATFAAGLGAVLLHLWFLMVHDHETWTWRSYMNRWAFRSVPSPRGSLLDRHGRTLAQDLPSAHLSLHYKAFRLRHPIGAAVHGAIRWARLQPGRDQVSYGYRDGVLGPEVALRDLLAMPAAALRSPLVPEEVRRELATTVTTVLAHASGWTRRKVYTAWRTAAEQAPATAVGDVLPMPRAELFAALRARYRELVAFDERLVAHEALRAERSGARAREGLLDTLEFLRVASLTGKRLPPQPGEDDDSGRLFEEVSRTFGEHVPFELAEVLRLEAADHPGLLVSPALTREVLLSPAGTKPCGSWISRKIDSAKKPTHRRIVDHRYSIAARTQPR